VTKPRIGALVGPVRVGKTTVAEHVAGLVRTQGLVCGGLLAPAIFDGCGQKVGIWGVDLRTGKRLTLARVDRELGGPTVGPYSFDAAALTWAIDVIRRDAGECDLLVVDELGRLELEEGCGLAPVLPDLRARRDGHSLVLVRNSLLDLLRTALSPIELELFQVTEDNRQDLPSRIVAAIL
jgi:nucleoside-triphosphatase THEP1